jgi:hypothetical protein
MHSALASRLWDRVTGFTSVERDLGKGRNNQTKVVKFLIEEGRSSPYQLTSGVEADKVLPHYTRIILLLAKYYDFVLRGEALSPVRVNSFLFSPLLYFYDFINFFLNFCLANSLNFPVFFVFPVMIHLLFSPSLSLQEFR